jgi:SAM-dependent methyltransferase
VRKVLRYEDNAAYWDRRWAEAERDPDSFEDTKIYPIRYANLVMRDPRASALELGAGLGRLLKHYRRFGYRIAGLERSTVAVRRLREEDPSIDIREGDVRALPYADAEFDVVLAFGLFHNIEDGLDDALRETARILRTGGAFCISMRPDNWEMNLNEVYWRWRRPRRPGDVPRFHKWLVGEDEFRRVLARHGLRTDAVHRARNLPITYRVPWLRERSRDETERRGRGYRLNALGRVIDRVLVTLFPAQFCNVTVFIGEKDGRPSSSG